MHWGTFGDPQAGGFVYLQYKAESWEFNTRHRSIPPAVSSTHPAADPESLVPLGMPVPQLAWKISRVGTQNGQRCLSPRHALRPHRHTGINNLDLFPGGVQQGLIH